MACNKSRGIRGLGATAAAVALVVSVGSSAPLPAYAASDSSSIDWATTDWEAERPVHDITVENATSGTYSLYKLFDAALYDGTATPEGDAAAFETDDGKTLVTKAEWVNADLLDAMARAYGQSQEAGAPSIDSSDPVAVVNAIHELGNPADDSPAAREFADDLGRILVEEDIAPQAEAEADADGVVEFADLPVGYYLVVQTDGSAAGGEEAMSSAMLVPLAAQDWRMKAKVSTPSLEKQVKDLNDGSWDSTWQHAADAGVIEAGQSDTQYRLIGTVASNILDYDAYEYRFVDVMPAGLDATAGEIDATWGVKALAFGDGAPDEGVDVTSAFACSTSVDDSGRTVVAWSSADLKSALLAAGLTLEDGSRATTAADGVDRADAARVELYYTPVYDQGDIERMYAQAGTLDAPDVNTAWIEFPHSPLFGGTGKSQPRETRLYDYALSIEKRAAGTSTPLSGATFSLVRGDGKEAGYQAVADDNGTFLFTGLEAGVEYAVVETSAPEGYAPIDPVKFTITADSDGEHVVSVSAAETDDPSNAAEFVGADGATFALKVDNQPQDTPGGAFPKTADAIRLGAIVLVAAGACAVIGSRLARRKEAGAGASRERAGR